MVSVIRNATNLDSLFRSTAVHIQNFFSKGWGDLNTLKGLQEFQKVVINKDLMLKNVYPQLKKVNVKIFEAESNPDFKVLKGEFKSPLTKIIPGALPPESTKASFQIILPHKWKDKKPICIHLAGTGDHYYRRRRKFMAQPLAQEGIASIVLENPFYGSRRPKDQSRSSVNYVSDIFVMGAALLVECVTLLLWCERNGFGPLGITGISMGGHMATVAASGWYKPLALTPCLSWTSAAPVFAEVRQVFYASYPIVL